MKKITIIMPVFNKEKYIRETIGFKPDVKRI